LYSSKYASYVAGQPTQLNAAALDKFAQDRTTPKPTIHMKNTTIRGADELLLIRDFFIAPSFFIDP
jgi:hypothetical protein